ncbi:MAG: hypothetical protein KAT71_07420 [Gammaproteobacteria bacterium]|nr:hypothetical protein [Gammaproteobacteria bacterium]
MRGYNEIPEKNLQLLAAKAKIALEALEHSLIKKEYPQGFYIRIKGSLTDIQQLITLRKDAERLYHKTNGMGQLSAWIICNIDKEYAKSLSAVGWEGSECFIPDDPIHKETRERKETIQKNKDNFLAIIARIKELFKLKFVTYSPLAMSREVRDTLEELNVIEQQTKKDTLPVYSRTMHPGKIKFFLPRKVAYWSKDQEILDLFKELDTQFKKL